MSHSNHFLEAMNLRHACKSFDPSKKISPEDQVKILEFGRLSPSSFGLEPWHFIVINNPEIRQALKPACWNQAQVTDAAFIVIYLAYLPHFFRRDSNLMRERLFRRTQDETRYQQVQARVIDYLADKNTGEWAKRQTYIPLANMMTGAASLGIDSCPMEGFELEKLKAALKDHIDWTQFDPVVLCAFGYRSGAQTPRFRDSVEHLYTVL